MPLAVFRPSLSLRGGALHSVEDQIEPGFIGHLHVGDDEIDVVCLELPQGHVDTIRRQHLVATARLDDELAVRLLQPSPVFCQDAGACAQEGVRDTL